MHDWESKCFTVVFESYSSNLFQSPFIPLRLENTALLLADELNAQQALAVAEALEEIQSRNLSLMSK